MTTFADFLDLVKARLSVAEANGDFDEAIRLLGLVRETCAETITKLERARDERMDTPR